MTVVENLQELLAIAEQKHGPNAPGAKASAAAARRDDVQKSNRQTENDRILSWRAGWSGKSKSESPPTQSSSEESKPKDRANDGGVDPPSVAAMQYRRPSKNPLEILTEGERHWFGQWLTPSQMLQGIKEASKFRNPNRKFVVLQILEGARIRAEKGLPPYGEPLGETFRKERGCALLRKSRAQQR